MADLKNIRVRKAKPTDHGLFSKLWLKMLEAQHEAGSTILPNDHNLEVALQLFNAYVDGDLDGVVLFVSDVGVLMWGDLASPYELSIGKRAAYGYGHYVDTEHRGKGIFDSMLGAAMKQLKDMGFDIVLGSTMEKDSHGYDALKRVAGEVHDTGERPCYIKLEE